MTAAGSFRRASSVYHAHDSRPASIGAGGYEGAGPEEDRTTEAHDVPAGAFASWVAGFRQARQEGRGASVPCGDCTACCTSSQFVHIEPDETTTISRIPRELLFPAPGLPRGHVVLGYDERGHCPMFVGGRCSIYEDRPRTCRAYDCRILPAAGLRPDRDEAAEIARRIGRWQFSFPTEWDRRTHAAVQAAATFLHDHRRQLPEGAVPGNPTQLAFLAVQIHDVFLDGDPDGDDDPGDRRPVAPTLDVVGAAVRRARTTRP